MPWLKGILFFFSLNSLILATAPSAKKASSRTDQQQLIHVAATIQKHEMDLFTIENELNQAREEESAILNDLNVYNQQLLEAIHYLRHTTQSSSLLAMLSAPKPEDIIHASILLRSITPELNARNQQLLEKLKILSQIRVRLEIKQDQLRNLTFRYHQEHEKLSSLLKSRSKNIQPLEAKTEDSSVSFALKVPVIGKLIPTYGSSDPKWASFAQGIIFKTRPGAHVISPISGKVAFAGDYAKGQGKMIIIGTTHSHIVMSGLESLNCTVEESISKGEPIGRMPIKLGQENQLYMEVWYQEQTVDPQSVLQEMKKEP